jgi:hypothetical protein
MNLGSAYGAVETRNTYLVGLRQRYHRAKRAHGIGVLSDSAPRNARQDSDHEQVTASAGRPLNEVIDPFALEVHRAIDAQSRTGDDADSAGAHRWCGAEFSLEIRRPATALAETSHIVGAGGFQSRAFAYRPAPVGDACCGEPVGPFGADLSDAYQRSALQAGFLLEVDGLAAVGALLDVLVAAAGPRRTGDPADRTWGLKSLSQGC